MPTYQYRCVECELAFEIVQSFEDAAVEKCPECDGVVRKQFSSVGVVFKGAGFYRTDSRSKPEVKKSEPAPKPAPSAKP